MLTDHMASKDEERDQQTTRSNHLDHHGLLG
jgi:hypothetical protein